MPRSTSATNQLVGAWKTLAEVSTMVQQRLEVSQDCTSWTYDGGWASMVSMKTIGGTILSYT